MGQRNFQLPGTMSETQVIASVELLTDQIQTLLAERDEWKDAATWVATSERPPPAPGVAMSGWRTDMENAPDDGTPVLLGVWDFGPDMATAAWNGAFWDMRFLDGEDIETVTTDRYNREFANPAAWLPLDALPPPPVSP